MTKLESTRIANLAKVEEELAELRSGQTAIGQTLGEINERQVAQTDRLADINVALVNIKSELTSIGHGIASLNDKQAESLEVLKEIRGHGKILKEIAASLKRG